MVELDESHPPRHLVSIADLTDGQLAHLLHRGCDYARGQDRSTKPLRDRLIGIYFRKTSTRTRTAFTAAALRLGAQVISYGPDDLQINTGETYADTGRVLSGMLDALVARTTGPPDELRNLARQQRMSVINAMTADEHPTQAIADLTTMLLRFGRLDHLRLLYLGEGNNTAAALALALTRFPGTELHLRAPAGYGLPSRIERIAEGQAERYGGSIHQRHDLNDLPEDVDVVYTTRWQTTGTSKEDPHWREHFAPFQVDERLLQRWPGATFMHDLPAHRGEEVTAAVLDGQSSIAFGQAQNKFHSACAVLEWCVTGETRTDTTGASRDEVPS